MSINKKNLLDLLHKKFPDLKENDIKYCLDHVLEYIKEEIAKNNRVEIRGFGSFSLRQRLFQKENKQYNTIYYRMSRKLSQEINKI